MPITQVAITPAQRDKLLLGKEGHFLEYKGKQVKPSKLSEGLSAFGNSDGGELYVGIGEPVGLGPRPWDGFANQEAANGHIQALEMVFPLGTDCDYTFLECEGSTGLVLQVVVQKTREIKPAAGGTVFVRRGAQKLAIISQEQRRRLEYEKGVASFETELVNANPTTVTNSLVTLEFMLDVVPTSEPETWLIKQQVLRDSRPTVAGALLFAEEPQALLPKRCGIKVYRYKTGEAEGSRATLAFTPITVEGHLYEQVRRAVERTVEVVEDVRRLGSSGLEAIAYPRDALHEIITNAVIHRDYSITDDVHIRVFDNRVEVESPGRLPGHMTVKNILKERFARNGHVVRLLNKFPNPPNKDVGEGLNTAFAAMHQLGLKEPIVEERENSVLVTVRHERLASPEETILEYLLEHDTIKNKQAREACHVSADYAIKQTFKGLEASGLIEQVPGTNTSSTAYRRGSKFDEWHATRAADRRG